MSLEEELRAGGPKRGGRSTREYLELIGVPTLPAAIVPFDPGYDLSTLESHLEQSAHLLAALKISMACWLIADETVTRRKVAAARSCGVPTITGGGPFEIAVAQGTLGEYLDLCADMGMSGVECAEGFTDMPLAPADVIPLASERGLEVEFEVGKKQERLSEATIDGMIERGAAWIEAGARHVIVEARESAQGVGLFDEAGNFDSELADRFVEVFGFETVVFEAPTKQSQFAILDHFGPQVRLGNVRLEEILRVEIYRRGLHSDSFLNPRLRPRPPKRATGSDDF